MVNNKPARQYRQVKLSLLRRHRKAVHLSHQAGIHIDSLVFNRFHRLAHVRRFIIGWIGFWLILAGLTTWQLTNLTGYFQTVEPIAGGIFNEGVLGTLTNVNPIYASGEVNSSLSKLIFAGLFTYNSQNQLVGCLASGYQISSNLRSYTVTLKPGLTWQDGAPLTSADVVFTIHTIQDSAAQSPLYSSWKDVTVQADGPLKVVFTLPNPLASFPYSLTLGILPEHILGNVNPSDLRSASFNTSDPVGDGPFKWQAIQVSGNTPQNAIEQVALTPFADYAMGKPKLQEFIVHAYASRSQLIAAFNAGQLDSMAGLNSIPDSIHPGNVKIYSPLLTAGVYVFFKTNSGILSDKTVRKALVLAAYPDAIIQRLGYLTLPVNEPLLIGQLAYNRQYAQTTGDLPAAKQLLAQDGWVTGAHGYRYKNGQLLGFNLVAVNTPENRLVIGMLKSQWYQLGVKLNPVLESADTYATTLVDHSYDATLDGIAIGIDPDVFVYWDSSQYDPRSSGMNLSEYDSASADQSLEAGRTRLNPALRIIKYQQFLADWQADAPALGLYQPRVLYITHHAIYNFSQGAINNSQDRFNNVQNWEILTAKVTDTRHGV